jgi:hypothetical protein
MIQIKPEYLKPYIINKLENALQDAYEREYTLTIEDIDDLHDYTIEDCEIDELYYALNSTLPLVLDECISYIEDAQDTYDPWKEHCDANFYGV